MPRQNRYPGINAHLNSHLQTEPGGWASFHSEHIIDIRRAITAHLPPGYYARSEKSLQISGYIQGDLTTQVRMKPDVSVYHDPATQTGTAAGSEAVASPSRVLAFSEIVFDLEDNPSAVTVYKVREDTGQGDPVTHIELMSPANKGGSPYAAQYAAKRQTTLRSGIHLVEIDYLHHQGPLLPQMPDYTQSAPNATPYSVLVSDVRRAETQIYEIGVLAPLPTLALPLANEDTVRLNLNTAYNRTYESLDGIPLTVDESVDPSALDRYTKADQQALRDFRERQQS